MSKPNLRFSVANTVNRLQTNYLEHQESIAGSEARRVLAELRKSAAREFGTDPLALERVLSTLTPPLSEGELGRGDAPSPSESAAYYALTLFAAHMQSATTPAHSEERTFAMACGRLQAISESGSLKARFDAMQTAREEASRLIHLRTLVSLLKGEKLAFDYGALAADLRSLQNPARRDGVLLRWGRDFAVGMLRPSQQDSPLTESESSDLPVTTN